MRDDGLRQGAIVRNEPLTAALDNMRGWLQRSKPHVSSLYMAVEGPSVLAVVNAFDTLRAENARLREALIKMLDSYAPYAQLTADREGPHVLHSAVSDARAALAKGGAE